MNIIVQIEELKHTIRHAYVASAFIDFVIPCSFVAEDCRRSRVLLASAPLVCIQMNVTNPRSSGTGS